MQNKNNIMPLDNKVMNEPNIDILRKNIKMLLSNNHITQSKLAEAIGMEQSNISKCLSDKDSKCFTIMQLIKIAEYFNVSLDWIIGKEKEVILDTSNKSILLMLSELLRNKKITFCEHTAKETGYELEYSDEVFGDHYTDYEIETSYKAFYFQDPPIDPYDEILGKSGPNNKELNSAINVLLDLQKHSLPKESYQTIVSNLIKD